MEKIPYPYAHKCKECGKEVFATPQWVYKRGSDYYCSWKCFNHKTGNKPKREIILPKVGDTIKILQVPNIPSYKGRVGVVEFYDTMGQLHGTWGKLVIIPGVDTYEIIEEKANDG